MKAYYWDDLVMLHHGDCLEGMRGLPDASVDCVVTDPPYGLSFMGKDWDKAVPSVEVWKECLRLLKPGAFAFVMCIPRQDCLGRMIVNLQDAGFDTGFTSIYWAYASGFPKAQNIGKAMDKRGGVSISWFGQWLRAWRKKKGLSSNDIGKLFPSKSGNLTGCVRNWELGFNMPTPEQFTKICRHFNLPFESLEEAEREVVGQRTKARVEGQKSALPTLGMPTEYITIDETIPYSPQAKALDGSYSFSPKPAVEVILVCRKPMAAKTHVDQALLWYEERQGVLRGIAAELQKCYNIAEDIEWENNNASRSLHQEA